jgi:hypothetical protein
MRAPYKAMASDCLSCICIANIDWLISHGQRPRSVPHSLCDPLELLGAQDDSALLQSIRRPAKLLVPGAHLLQTCAMDSTRGVGLVSSELWRHLDPPEGQAAGIVGEGLFTEQVLPRRDDGMLGHKHHAASHPVQQKTMER